MKVFKIETAISIGLIGTVLYIGGALFTCTTNAKPRKPAFTQDVTLLCVQMIEAGQAGDLILESKTISRIEALSGKDSNEACGLEN